MSQEPQQPPLEPTPGQPAPPTGPAGTAPIAPGQLPPAPPVPPQPQWGQYSQPQQPAQPQWGQYAQQPQQPQWGQYSQPQQPGYPQQYPQQNQQQGFNQPGYGYNYYVPPPKPGVIPLRPLRLGEVLDGAFQAARHNGKAMFGSALIFQILTSTLTLLVVLVGFGQSGLNILGGTYLQGQPTEAELSGLLTTGLRVFGALAVVSFLSGLAQMVLQGALVIPVLRAVLNRKTGFSEMWRLVRPRIGTLILLALFYAAAALLATALFFGILIGMLFAVGGRNGPGANLASLGLGLLIGLAFLAAAIWVGTKVLLAPAAIVVENIGLLAAIKRSWQLTSRNWWRTFGITALAAIIASVIGGIISTPVSLFLGFLLPLLTPNATQEQLLSQAIIAQVISTFIGAMIGAITLAFQSGVMSLIYVDLRMRRDGFDVTLLKESEEGKDDGGIPGRGTPLPPAGGQYPPAAYPPAPFNGQ
ncbi:hypothetical protein [Arthrobacter sp. GMC3]|uniref:hypothetical protein n=1 Tax=Arthrobacter sp. GMC3 TaxID=2058894 RepID=UPI0011B05B57|nr:hypothetical protein [Arthrobacter sp. GMC3]